MTILTKPIGPIAICCLFVVAGLAGGPASGLEAQVMQSMADYRDQWPAVTPLVVGITNIGGAYVTLGVTSVAALWLLIRRAPARALLLAGTVLVERSLVDVLKEGIGRPRPDFGVDWLPASLAYPSGHAANSMTAFLATALILAPAGHRRPWAIGALLLAFIVGLSRVYLGVHWPTDVIGGWMFGLLAVAIALAIGRRSTPLHFELQHEVVGRHRPALDEDKAA